MNWKHGAISLFAGIGVLAVTSVAGVAQTTQVQTTQAQTAQAQATTKQGAAKARPKTRVTVPPRSFLDAGTEVLPGERKFNDYAFPPGYSVLDSSLGPGRDFRRQPLNNPWDIPGSIKF